MKLHYGAFIIIGISLFGILFFSVTPVISGKDSFYFNSDNWTESRVLAFGFGNGKTISEGELLGNPFDDTNLVQLMNGQKHILYMFLC
ncbi:MAG: hypothetical protein ACFFDW_10965 [Candidatus Thorarchaeota archaeon]